jgi:hypothetical protein
VDVDKCREDIRDDDVGGQEGDVVVVYERPDFEFGALEEGSCC